MSRLQDGIWELFSTQFIHQPGKRLLKAIQLTLSCFVQVSALPVPDLIQVDVWVHTRRSLSVLHLHAMGLGSKSHYDT